ncbi:MAG TPA: 3'(2'),5'-bisphosphate nucleotidase CysQ [Arsenophonus apicola]|uniref:3'(2'),5'-bisphosphate nucleotidase CysQ n=1 Tax=Arsenophonus TaxID=637 RepID=UPI0015D79825|nr:MULTISPECIES: 3'(2'),5'-bisphosphate nucleotidase CysQ [Arsenophonus]UBX29354.1 3'(2'),5'-bisphosphate nucleotidase CysQ [Arsenophonus apicola]
MLEQLCDLAKEAGRAIMTIYESGQQLSVKHKKDSSPVTEADLIAHQIIKTGLARITPHIPLLSEEAPPAWHERCHWECYWLVDPLDGTKEFIQRNGEFTVNIALIKSGSPVMGIIYAPAKNILYASEQGTAWKIEEGVKQSLHVANGYPPLIVISRSYQDKELIDYLAQMGQHEVMEMGSSLKFCLIAEGKAQLYPRFGPTHIWDTAAGHAIAQAAGAKVTDWYGRTLNYSLRESFINPGFRVSIF